MRLSPGLKDRPGLDELLVAAQKRWDAMTAEQRKQMLESQRKSWAIGELMMDRPDMTRAEADEIYEKVVLGIGL